MRWLRRSMVLCVLMVAVTPAPAYAWFEWLDYLSGPGRWYGAKVDVRAFCFGRSTDPNLEKDLAKLPVTDRELVDLAAAEKDWAAILKRIRDLDDGLHVLTPKLDGADQTVNTLFKGARDAKLQAQATTVDTLQRLQKDLQADVALVRKADLAIASTGIFISLCSYEKRKSFGVELGVTGMGTRGNQNFANGHAIWLTTFTGGLSYRLPLPKTRDFADLGANVGIYRFYSKGFENFSGWTIEPFTDVHLPTNYVLSDSQWARFFARFTLRAGLVFFPGGFKADQFASAPSKSDISGREATTSITVFFRLRP